MFHNTISLPAAELKPATQRTVKQEDIIYTYLTWHPGVNFTAWQIWEALRAMDCEILITSVRRTLSDLAKAGKIIHDKGLVKGKYNVKNTTYCFEAGQLRLI